MSKIISTEQIEGATVLISCGEEQGSGFYVSQNHVLTAYHVLEDHFDLGAPIIVNGTEFGPECIIASDAYLDLCLVKVSECEVYLPMLNSKQSYKQPCSVFGYPYKSDIKGDHFAGAINKIETVRHWDFSIGCEGVESDIDYSGLSGGAVISENGVIGIILMQFEKSLRCISVRKAYEFLEANHLELIKEKGPDEIPDQLRYNVEQSTPNYSVFEELNNKLSEVRGWLLATGSPGSGKTTLIASYEPKDENIIVGGKYFVKIPEDDKSIAVRSSTRHVLTWIEDSIGNLLGFNIDSESDTDKRIARITELFNALNQALNDNHCVFFLDGLDEIPDLDSFLAIFPVNLPSNVSFVLSCTSRDILPTSIKTAINDSSTVSVIPLDIDQCASFLLERFKDTGENYEIEDVHKIAIKSEGHPLYLQYLSQFVLLNDISADKLGEWIVNVPEIGGDIAKYYESLWDDFYQDESKLWIVITLSQLRGKVNLDTLIKMMPEQYRLSVISKLDPIRYLLIGGDYIEIYHSSFKAFISGKTEAYTQTSNDNIVKFCQEEASSSYSLENLVFHLLNSTHPENCFSKCNQDWADKCAIGHVSPDLIINDIRSVLNFAVDKNSANNVLKLLLLLQRVEFRYDSVFAENATHIALALVSLEQYDKAIKYLVRDHKLIVSDEDAIRFLQLLYERDAIEQAEELLYAFNTRFIYFIEEDLNRYVPGTPLSFEPFVHKASALSISSKSKGETQILKALKLIGDLRRFENAAERDGQPELQEQFYRIREHSSGSIAAYTMRYGNRFVSSEEISQTMELTIDRGWARMKSMPIILFNELNSYATARIEKNESYQGSIADVEWLIDNHGYDEDEYTLHVIIEALLYDSSRFDILEQIIGLRMGQINISDSRLRESNGVDLDYKNIHLYYSKSLYEGYLDSSEVISLPERFSRVHSWERFYWDIINRLGKLEGQLTRSNLASENHEAGLETLKSLTKLTELRLPERASWERSYLLVEDLYPFIFEKICGLFLKFFSAEKSWLFDYLKQQSEFQFGIYSEGFRALLGDTIRCYFENDILDNETEELIDMLKVYIEDNVENRWERTPELVKVVEYYGILGQKDKALDTYESMLRTSMGPSWYKEAQLQLLNSTYRLPIDESKKRAYASSFAGLLDCASGEMTFQRYIRQEKESFAGDLTANDSAQNGFKYIQYETIPPSEIVINKAEGKKIDNLKEGYGYENGARSITIQAGVLAILDSTKELSPHLRYALSSVFAINDDVFRYSPDFASHMARAINDISSDAHKMEIRAELAGIIESEELKDEKGNFVRSFLTDLKEEEYVKFRESVEGEVAGITLPEVSVSSTNNPNTEESEFKENALSDFVEECNTGNADRIDLRKQGVAAFSQERVSIWYTNWSNESKAARVRLRDLCTSTAELVETLSPFLKNYRVNSWTVADQIIWFAENCSTEAEIDLFYKDISAHFEYLIRPEEGYQQNYNWLNNEQTYDCDESAIRFLVWLSRHPLNWINEKAKSALTILLKHHSSQSVSALVDLTLSEDALDFGEDCSFLLLNNLESISESLGHLFRTPELLERISKIPHFTILANYLKIANELASNGSTELLEKLEDIFPEKIIGNSEVALEESMLEPIDNELYKFNEMQLLNRVFCEDIIQSVTSLVSPMSWSDYQKSDEYLKRSYHENRSYMGRYPLITKYALNKSILPRVGKNNFEEVYQILNP